MNFRGESQMEQIFPRKVVFFSGSSGKYRSSRLCKSLEIQIELTAPLESTLRERDARNSTVISDDEIYNAV